jgi:ubiquinol oxidase
LSRSDVAFQNSPVFFFCFVPPELTPQQAEVRRKLGQLTLNSTAIWERELKDGPIEGPLVIKIPYLFLCYMLDYVFENKYVPSRFFLLETVARMPYFAYITMLHLYESLGFWRRSADVKRIHFAEELNEFHHLMIMESLGGDQQYWVRWMAQHSAIAYYIGLCLLWALSPSLSYKFSELLESHAVNTYSQFLDENEALLKTLPPSLAAVDYYALGSYDPYYAEFQTAAIKEEKEIRRPGLDMRNLYDVFSAIRDDEGDHVSTMESCMDPTVAKLSPSLERRALTAVAAAVAIGVFLGTSGGGGVSSDLVDTAADLGAAATDDAAVATGLVEGAIAGAFGALTRSGIDVEQELGTIEEGAFLGLRGVFSELMKIFSRLL